MVLYLSPYLAHFIILFAKHPCFCFAESLTIGFAIDKVKSRGADITIGFFE